VRGAFTADRDKFRTGYLTVSGFPDNKGNVHFKTLGYCDQILLLLLWRHT